MCVDDNDDDGDDDDPLVLGGGDSVVVVVGDMSFVVVALEECSAVDMLSVCVALEERSAVLLVMDFRGQSVDTLSKVIRSVAAAGTCFLLDARRAHARTPGTHVQQELSRGSA